MAASALAFKTADISVYQLLIAKPDRPWVYGRARLLAADDT
jgi:hypothetical protein